MKNVNKLKRIVEEVYLEILEEQAMLKTSSEELLQKFPSLRKVLTDLLTQNYPEFVDQVKWISPKPSTFEIKLKNGEGFVIRWDGEGFVAEIAGKNYQISSVKDYQRALAALGDIFQTGPIKTAAELEADAEEDLADDDMFGGGDDFEGGDFGDDELPDEPEEEPEPDFEEI